MTPIDRLFQPVQILPPSSWDGRNSTTRVIFGLVLAMALILSTTPAHAQDLDEDDDFFIFDDDDFPASPQVADPLEELNRVIFRLNDKLYRHVAKPVARGWRVLPTGARLSIANFFNNLSTPVSALNALLQLDMKATGTEASRFLINSSLGILGLFDPATEMGLARDNRDLGQTLGRYGVGHGIYLVLPGIGPSSLRDGSTNFVNTVMLDPFLRQRQLHEIVVLRTVEGTNTLSLDRDTYEAFYANALDPYAFFRSAYIQNRDARVNR